MNALLCKPLAYKEPTQEAIEAQANLVEPVTKEVDEAQANLVEPVTKEVDEAQAKQEGVQ
tara:strand:- start:292 stop:471 length:180 start_codon:yes stop_codon:yes gene_type:complete